MLRNAFEAMASEATLVDVQRRIPDSDRRVEWQAISGVDYPLYVGHAAPGTGTAAATWSVQKFTWAAGPAGGQVANRVETRVGSWDNRAALF